MAAKSAGGPAILLLSRLFGRRGIGLPNRRGSFITWIDLTAGIIALAVYVSTCAPSITWRNEAADSGDLATAAVTLGIPHPSGYPLYTILGAIFTRLPLGEPAHNLNLFSALAATASIVLLSALARRLMRVDDPLWVNHIGPPSLALTVAFSPALWSQATVAELYALSALFLVVLMAALLGGNPHRVGLTMAVLGLALTHHLTIAFFIPSVILLLAQTPRWTVLRNAALGSAALLLYLYLPLRAQSHPPVNWGDAHTLQGFLWTVTGAPYRGYFFDLSLAEVFGRVSAAARLLFQQFQPWGVLLGLWGSAQMATSTDSRRQFWALALGGLLSSAYAVLYASRNSFVYLLPVFILFALWMAWGLGDLAQRTRMHWSRFGLLILLLVLPAFNLVTQYPGMNLSHDKEAYAYAQRAIETLPRDAVIIADGDQHLFALWYYRYVVQPNLSQIAIVSQELIQYDWYYEQVRREIPYPSPDTLGATTAINYGARLAEIINHSLAQGRPVYTTAKSDWMADYIVEPEGALFEIKARGR